MNVAYEQEQPAHAEVAVADTLDHDPAELVAQLSHRILLLQQQAQSLARFPGNRDGKQQRQLLQQQIRNLYQQLFALEQQQAQQRRRSENYLSMALSVAAHAAHQHAHGETVAPAL
ncbi:FlxA-like family protein [Herbaspirillum huttiense]|jgi:50S ribosomal subunit-associated GTPase HflX|uniref:FlxA-like family protein n=1 Tax=Herbaspirillum huttiense subsp. lycopersici TaxID=3074428 RepID=A0ABU2EUV7_9BURK|nr:MULTISPECIES: FlxA-like family protein [Herbaspirillum]MAF06062.1 hypothetical protein [Herbaspirillum sp.]MBN9357989.1 FlxA-like family protein [Herbaspirillum huttiense]MBO16785.1 hypothetical protein [Herbaspirillum sp.]MBP1316062.1 50S ribosomal subunit-associated GTPase HflX [Herbaspirillum sp. 1130]MCO4857958.1 FlxA-like family protein [Herbaspirillum sp. WGmk3]|tara:strand:- start:3677 stop:4024 length:348 start_codon:yes stop_codon:yes gene_type:complete